MHVVAEQSHRETSDSSSEAISGLSHIQNRSGHVRYALKNAEAASSFR